MKNKRLIIIFFIVIIAFIPNITKANSDVHESFFEDEDNNLEENSVQIELEEISVQNVIVSDNSQEENIDDGSFYGEQIENDSGCSIKEIVSENSVDTDKINNIEIDEFNYYEENKLDTNIMESNFCNQEDCINTLSTDDDEKKQESKIENGEYEIRTATDEKLVFDISSASYNNGAKLQLWSDLDSAQQRFYISDVGKGYYTITVSKSNKMIDVQDAGKNERNTSSTIFKQ